jgi:hypothetical protein
MPRNNASAVYANEQIEAHTKQRYKLNKNPEMMYRMIFLKFPESVELSDEMFSPSSTTGAMQMNTVPLLTEVEQFGLKFISACARNSWLVQILDEAAEQVEDSSDMDNTNHFNRMKELLANIRLGNA